MCFDENSRGCYCCSRKSHDYDETTKYISSDNEIIVVERRYGCYRLGIFVAIIIVSLLILGTIPVTLTVKNNQILLICLCSTLVVVTILLSLFIVWQQRQAKRQRERSTRPFIMQKQNKNAMYTSVPTTSSSSSPSARTSWMFWQNNKNDFVDHPLRCQSIKHNPTKISSLQEVSEAPQYTTVV
ncbi:uncharacterized protein LOC116346958 [Contarinia nasturtii]|uniref:uncharacterized protein LOC116346958 n=1 Tax=Contarinia nasturtii TaxID=265458 RepID=UPI0012D38B9C|nr:uncharacterized protein LOC116346958 [Contarinia nasturtii]